MTRYTFWHLHAAGGELIAGLYCDRCGEGSKAATKLVTKRKDKVGTMTDGQMELLINKVTGAMQLRVTEIAEMMRAYWKDCRITGERPKARDKGVEFEPPFEEQATARDPMVIGKKVIEADDELMTSEIVHVGAERVEVSPAMMARLPVPASAKLLQMRYRIAMKAWRESDGDPSGEAAGKLRVLHLEANAKMVDLAWEEDDPFAECESPIAAAVNAVTDPIVEPPAKLSAASLVLKPAPKKAGSKKAAPSAPSAKKGHSGASRRPTPKRKR